MGQENFHASVQYGDMKGTAAADDHDTRSLRRYLVDKGLIKDGEALVGVQMWSGEVHGNAQNKPVSVHALVSSYDGYDNVKAAAESGKPLHVRKIQFDMPLNEFFGLFKRFEITISAHGVIDGQDITFDE